jgi:hypothetical protein
MSRFFHNALSAMRSNRWGHLRGPSAARLSRPRARDDFVAKQVWWKATMTIRMNALARAPLAAITLVVFAVTVRALPAKDFVGCRLES